MTTPICSNRASPILCSPFSGCTTSRRRSRSKWTWTIWRSRTSSRWARRRRSCCARRGTAVIESVEARVPVSSPDTSAARHDEFKAFVARHVAPCAEQWDRDQQIPESVLAMMAQCGYLGSILPRDVGGQGWDVVTFGMLNEAFGRGSSALTGVLTVQAMVSMALLKWGTADQKRAWLPRLAK